MRAAAALLAAFGGCQGANIVIYGDSWAVPGTQFRNMLDRHGDTRTVQNVMPIGTTCSAMAGGIFLPLLRAAVSQADVEHVWLICGGNDAMGGLPGCYLTGRSQDECTASLIAESKGHIQTIVNTIHEANPRARVAGFGYDTFGFNGLCNALSITFLPACVGGAECVNRECLKIQGVYDEMAREVPHFDAVNLWGSLQAASGVEGARVGHPVMTQFAPAGYYPDCIHPAGNGGYAAILDNFYELYWRHSKKTGGNATLVQSVNTHPDQHKV